MSQSVLSQTLLPIPIQSGNNPVVDAGPDQTVVWGSPVTLAGSYTDDASPDSVTALWTLVSGPDGAAIADATITNTTVSFTQGGVYLFQLTVDDGTGEGSAQAAVTVDQGPMVTIATPAIINWPGNQVTLTGTVIDDGLPADAALSSVWNGVSGPGNVTFSTTAQTDALTGDSVTKPVVTTATFDQSGTYVLSLTADDTLATNTATVTVVVNQTPVVFAGASQMVDSGTTVTLAGLVTDDGLPYNTLNAMWTEVSGPGTATFANANLTNSTVTFDLPGTYTLRLTGDDGYATNSADVVVDVHAAPVVSAGTNQTVILGAAVTLAGSYTNDGSAVTVQWTQASGPSGAVITDTAATNTTVNFTQSGVYVFQLAVNDGMASSTAQVVVTVDQGPIVAIAAPAIINWPSNQVTLTGTVADDGLPVGATRNVNASTAFLVSSDWGSGAIATLWITNNSSSAITNQLLEFDFDREITVFNNLAIASHVGNHYTLTNLTYYPTVVAAGATINFQMMVTPGNLNGAQPTNCLINGLPLNGYSTEAGTLNTVWNGVSGPGNVTFSTTAQTDALTGSSVTNSVVTTATFDQSGTYVLSLTADDTLVTNATTVTVMVNQAPVVSAGASQTVNSGTTVTLAGLVTDDGLPYNTLNALWTEVSGPGTATFANASLTNSTVTFDLPGIYTLRLTGDDGYATNSAEVVVNVHAAPVVSAGTNQTVILGAPVALTGSYTDDGLSGSAVVVQWTQASGPSGAVIANAAATNTTVSFTQSGVYGFQLAANDGMASGTAQVFVTVDQGPAVAIAAPAIINWPSNQVILTGTVTDDGLPAGAALNSVWNVVSGPGNVVFSSATQTNILTGSSVTNPVATTATFDQSGTYVLSLTADDTLATNTATVTVVVNQAPVVSAGASQTVNSGTTVTLAGLVTDDGLPDAILNALWTEVSGPGTATFANASLTNSTVTFDLPGTYTLRLTGDDGYATNSAEVVVSINTAPVVNAGTNQTVILGLQWR